MPRRTSRRFHLAVIAVLAAGMVGSITWMVWYDMRKGFSAPVLSENDAEEFLGLAARDVRADIRRTRRTIQPDGFLGSNFARFHLGGKTCSKGRLTCPPHTGTDRT